MQTIEIIGRLLTVWFDVQMFVAHYSGENKRKKMTRMTSDVVRVLAIQLAPKIQLLSLFSHTCDIFVYASAQNRRAQHIIDSAFVRVFEHRRIV